MISAGYEVERGTHSIEKLSYRKMAKNWQIA